MVLILFKKLKLDYFHKIFTLFELFLTGISDKFNKH